MVPGDQFQQDLKKIYKECGDAMDADIKGQEFHPEGWNTLVKWDDRCFMENDN